MKPQILIIIGMILLPILAACQTLSKEECVAADWQVIGEQDGAKGQDPQKRFARHAKACEKAGVVPDQTLWNAGFQIGIRRFCTPLNGLAHGQKAGTYNNICPADLAAGFDEGYRLGFKENRKLSEIASLNSQISVSQSTIEENRNLISQGKIDQIEGERSIRWEETRINDYNRQIGRKEVELEQIRSEIEDFRFRQQFGGNG